MTNPKAIVFGIGCFLVLGGVANTFFYWGYLIALSEMKIHPTEFHENLLGLRFLVVLGLIIFTSGFFLRRRVGFLVSTVSLIILSLFYVLWYREKFQWLEGIGFQAGSHNYAEKLVEIGWFRGSNEWDLIVLFFLPILLVASLILQRKKQTS